MTSTDVRVLAMLLKAQTALNVGGLLALLVALLWAASGRAAVVEPLAESNGHGAASCCGVVSPMISHGPLR